MSDLLPMLSFISMMIPLLDIDVDGGDARPSISGTDRRATSGSTNLSPARARGQAFRHETGSGGNGTLRGGNGAGRTAFGAPAIIKS